MKPTLPSASVDTTLDMRGLGRLKRMAREGDSQATAAAAEQFEAMLVKTLLKDVREAGGDNPLFGDARSGLYGQLYDDHMAQNLARSGRLGFARMLTQAIGPAEASAPVDDMTKGLTRGGAGGAKSATGPASGQGPGAPSHDTGPDAVFAERLWQWRQAAAMPEQAGKGAPGPDHAMAGRPGFDPMTAGQFEHRVRALIGAPTAQAAPAAAVSGPTSAAERFVADNWNAAAEAANRIGTRPEAVLAVAALETGWGKHVAARADGESSHNLFGIKAGRSWSREQTRASTLEFRDGAMQRQVEPFRVYDSARGAFDDFANLIVNSPRYAEARKHAADPVRFVNELQRAGYATDPSYAAKLERVLASQALKQASNGHA